MRKLIDIDEMTLTKLKMISVFKNVSVKTLVENAVKAYVTNRELERFSKMTDEEKEDLGLLLLMQEADRTDKVSEEEVFKVLSS